ncbi:hypothetical protein [Amycolatopsis sp. H20-H5]|uniref:hypothetical protein n=1 Tax=Amycolatopsis sp. H20-H5 TaxID=3046309 RepID=UPI002DBF1EA2|nr:hypothetical protein [Amycolatopsis sp. H20-H5]MEC3975797.1 hypothetical protein [Amycolatopsis sp. H20-H5]
MTASASARVQSAYSGPSGASRVNIGQAVCVSGSWAARTGRDVVQSDDADVDVAAVEGLTAAGCDVEQGVAVDFIG